MLKTVKKENFEWVSSIILNRPEKLNALSNQMIDELYDTITDLKNDPPQVLLIQGAGSNFCSGHDLSDPAPDVDSEKDQERLFKMQGITKLITEFPAPVIASVEGYALGAGSEIALNCDLIYASEDAVFGFPELKVGLSITQGSSYFLPRAIGLPKAKELLFYSKNLTAAEAKELGLINHVFANDEMEEKVQENIVALQDVSPAAVAAIKKLFNQGAQASLEKSLVSEIEALKHLMGGK